MSTVSSNVPFSNYDNNSSQSPPKPSSPASPTFATHSQTAFRYRDIIRGQNAPFPATPTSSHSSSHNHTHTHTHTQSFLEPPAHLTYAEFLQTWTDVHVARWLNDIKCGNLSQVFKTNDIRGDVLLELDQVGLKEMGITSIGDRLRILNAIKTLRQRAATRSPLVSPAVDRPISHSLDHPRDEVTNGTDDSRGDISPYRQEPRRPPPLNLKSANGQRPDLPYLAREHPPDSARSNSGVNPVSAIRPLPQPNQIPSSSSSSHTPSSSFSRTSHPPLPPIPRAQPPPPPASRGPAARLISTPTGRRTPTQDVPVYVTQPPPPAPNQAPAAWSAKPADARTGSPYSQLRPNPVHSRHGSSGISPPTGSSPITKQLWGSANYYGNTSLQPPPTQQYNLPSIVESFQSHTPSSVSPLGFPPSRNHNSPNHSHPNAPSLDDLRRKIVKFVLADNTQTFSIDVGSCMTGAEILEKAIKKIGGSGLRNDSDRLEIIQNDENGLNIDGWGVYLNMGQGDGPAAPLTGLELLSICQGDHPIREHGLTLRRSAIARNKDNAAHGKFLQTAKSTKRASSISILSGLGVDDPEKALNPPSPTQSGRLSPTPQRKPSKLRNFFGQRPPSELITTHLTEYFPFTEKKVLERTARHSMLRSNTVASRRDSTASGYQSRFSTTTQVLQQQPSFSSDVEPQPFPDKSRQLSTKVNQEDVPRVSLSTEDGRSIDLKVGDSSPTPSTSQRQLLPPIPFPSQSFSESLENITGRGNPSNSNHRASRAASIAAKRMSYMSDLRSKRDKSDTASLMTVDEITAEVESRTNMEEEEDKDDWTKIENEDTMVDNTPDQEQGNKERDAVEDEAEEAEEEAENEDEDDQPGKPRKSKDGGIKWIQGALIGAGSFGKVYLGMDATNGLLMAIKQVELPSHTAPNPERKKAMLSALEREIELLKDLQHPNIVQYLHSCLDDEHLNIFLEYVPGGSVTALLRNYGAFEETLVKNFVRQILEGLNYLHERDIIHRDIKGANILVDNKGGVKISDFGISKKVDDTPITGNKMHRPSLQGSVFWMAPEVVKQSVHTQKADIWSVGCLVVEMLTGEHPWAQLTQMQAIFKIGSSAIPTVPSDISAEAQDFLQLTFKLDHHARPTAIELLKHSWIVGKKSKSSTV